MVGNTGVADRSEINCVKWAKLIQTVVRHHAAGLEISLTTPVKVLPGKRNVEATGDRFEHANSFGHNLAPDAVSCNDGNLVTFQVSSPPMSLNINKARLRQCILFSGHRRFFRRFA